ncbi:PP2C family protein-serine/threonine phosphatase [Phreatobacter stygius]|uniref:Serine/threonine-protein phosphatase n=1 Tax=Phreatobacter stygius TaxID=1940610 RepID=A0A4D7ARN5_9HYPH|nr:protein phosphatase 2C domain-containing protein [Phreatobacter stygius]QCI64054.1 serine/threonine-protein phosphatase [Phreatobacter stygius]
MPARRSPQDNGLTFETAAASHVGCVRGENQDAFIARSDIGLWAVADGVGGLSDGQLASATMVEALATIGPPATAADLLAQFEERAWQANRALRRYAVEKEVSLGTTVVALLVFDDAYACVWAGDSRLYLVRDGAISCVSEDHTEAAALLKRGLVTAEEAQNWPRRNIITRAIGVVDEVELDIAQGKAEDGDVFVLCSDGLNTHLADAEILALLAGRTPRAACDALVDATLSRGATDNVTVIVVCLRGHEKTGSTRNPRERTVLMSRRNAADG